MTPKPPILGQKPRFWTIFGHFGVIFGQNGVILDQNPRFWTIFGHFRPIFGQKGGIFDPSSGTPRSKPLDLGGPRSGGSGSRGVQIQGVQIQGVQNGVDFGVILRVQNSSKSAQFVVFRMLLHMYNMYLYTPYNIYICIICVNMWNVGYEGYPMAGLGVVMAGDGPHIT